MKIPSNLSTKISSKLFVSIYPIATGIIDNKGIYKSKSFPNILKILISGILDRTAYKSVLVLKDSEISEMINDKTIISKPSEVEIMNGIICELEFLSKDPETSEVVDDEAIVSKPSEVKTKESIIYIQYLLNNIIIDLIESNNEESAPLVIIGKVQKESSIISSKKHKLSECLKAKIMYHRLDDVQGKKRHFADTLAMRINY
ncbi:hypothetical protein EAF04_000792 [Stromatinia cepivora]|nr:hypothetical protein EAF04_000792 [Stromatinia cepivora]